MEQKLTIFLVNVRDPTSYISACSTHNYSTRNLWMPNTSILMLDYYHYRYFLGVHQVCYRRSRCLGGRRSARPIFPLWPTARFSLILAIIHADAALSTCTPIVTSTNTAFPFSSFLSRLAAAFFYCTLVYSICNIWISHAPLTESYLVFASNSRCFLHINSKFFAIFHD